MKREKRKKKHLALKENTLERQKSKRVYTYVYNRELQIEHEKNFTVRQMKQTRNVIKRRSEIEVDWRNQ